MISSKHQDNQIVNTKLHLLNTPKNDCPKHGKLTHIPCSCKCQVIDSGDRWEIRHFGNHNHPIPPWNGPLDIATENEINKVISIAPELKSLQLLTGTPTRTSFRDMNPSLNNLQRITYHRTKVLKRQRENTKITLTDMLKSVGVGLLKKLK